MKDGRHSLDCLKKDYPWAIILKKENIDRVCPQGVQVVIVEVHPLKSKQRLPLSLRSSYCCLGANKVYSSW